MIIIAGGAVGLGVALEITRRFPRRKLLLVEKENQVARHQSDHNSGVIHSGLYYKPGSLKARLCVRGAAAMVEFCREHAIHATCAEKSLSRPTKKNFRNWRGYASGAERTDLGASA